MLLAVKSANIRDAGLRDQAMRAAKSACLNCAEGAGRVTRAAAACGYASELDVERVARLADRIVAMLTRLIR
jgi:hypothetical protein